MARRTSPPVRPGLSSRTLFGQGAMYSVATLAPMATALAVTPIVTRTLGPHEYGKIAIALSVIQLGAVTAAFGMPASITRRVALDRSAVHGATAQSVGTALLAAALLVPSLLLLALWSQIMSASVMVHVLTSAAVSAAALATTNAVQAAARGLGQASRFVAQAMAVAVVPPSVGLLSIFAWGADAQMYIFGLAVGHTLVASSVLVSLLRRFPPSSIRSELRHGLRVGLPTVPHQLAIIGASSLLVLIAAATVGAEAAGEVQIAVMIGSLPLILVGALNNSWAVQVYVSSPQERIAFVESSAMKVATFALLVSWGTALISPFITQLMSTPAMDRSLMVSISVLVTCGAGLMVIYLANVHLVFVSGRTGLLALTTPCALAIALTLGLVGLEMLASRQTVSLGASLVAFHLVQALISTVLRKRAGYPQLRLHGPYAVAGVAAGGAITLLVLQPAFWVSAVLLTIVAVAGIAFVWSNTSTIGESSPIPR